MDLESGGIEPNYIKLDFKNRIQFINEKDINEDNLDLEAVIESFTQQITLEELNSFIYKLIPKNRNDIFKLNIDQSKHYKKQYPFTTQNVIDSVRKILATDFKSNFAFNQQNIEDVARIMTHIFESIKKHKINNEKTLKEKIKNIKFNENDIFNMFIDIEMMNEKKSQRILRIKNKKKSLFYSNKNPSSFNSTGNLPMVDEKIREENFDNNDEDLFSSKSRKNKNYLYKILSSSSESDNDNEEKDDKYNEDNNMNKGKNKIKKMFRKIKKKGKNFMERKSLFCKKSNDMPKKRNLNTFTQDNKILVTKEYFIYPENNYGLEDKKLDLPIELVILVKKFEKIKILTFQIKDADQKTIKENIFLLLNINLLFPNFTEIKIDLNDEELQKKINNLYEIRALELMHRFKKDLRIFQYKQDYKARTANCWDPEGDITFIEENDDENDIKYKYTSFGNNYILGENAFENSNFFGNSLKNIINNYDNTYNNDKKINIKYIIPIKADNISFLNNDSTNKNDEDENEEVSFQINKEDVVTPSEFIIIEKPKIITPETRNRSLTSLSINNKSKEKQAIDKITDNKKRKKTTPELLNLFIQDNEAPFQMILIYCWFLDKLLNIKTLSLYFYDSFSIETEFFLRNEDIRLDGFHFLFFFNQIKNLNEVNFSFNSLDTRSFENILGLIELNKKITKLRINFFTPDINCNIISLLKICSIMKLSLQTLFKEQRLKYISEKEPKDFEMEYFILDHKLEYYFEKNICCLFNIIKKNININNYEEIVFRFDLPLLILSCDKYLILIIKFISNILNLITFTKNKINIFKLISPELILDGRITPCLRYLFKELYIEDYINNDNLRQIKEYACNKSLKEITLQCKIFGIPNIFNICLFNNITGLTYISIGDLDLESFNGFLDDYKKYIDKMSSLMTLKIGINNSILSYEEIEYKIKEFINVKSINLKNKVLFSFLEFKNIEQINELRKCVLHSKMEKLVVQIGQNNKILLNTCEFNDNEKYKTELESLYYVMTNNSYNILIKDKIIKNIRRYFKKNKEKIVVCKPYFSLSDI